MAINEQLQARLSTARRWLEQLTADDEVLTPGELDYIFVQFVRKYTLDLEYTAGITSPYKDDLDRLQRIKDTVRSTNGLYEHLAALVGEDDVLQEVWTILDFMNTATLYLACVIRAIEEQHPELTDYFASERVMYDVWLQGDGPLAGTPWQFESETA